MSFYVTTPIYYVNAEPHLGHAYSTISADILARHMRQRGEDVLFVTGTDEHGEPVVVAAEAQQTTPQELVDRNAPRFEALLEHIDVTNDFFIRTTNPEHMAEVQRVWQQIHDNGFVYKGEYEGWYCPKCADFKSEREIGEGNTCPIHRIPLEALKEESWFFKLSAFEDRLKQLYADQPDWVLPRHRYNEALSFIEGGLRDVALSRSKLDWGVPLPWDDSHVMYVWFDALLNYWTAPVITGKPEYWPPQVHVMAKDIIKFHAVFWPAMLMAMNAPLPERMFVHGYLLMDGEKMSKSLGNVLDPMHVVDLFGSDALRFYCFREVSFGNDGSISTSGFETRYNTELANEYGNLVSRTLAMIGKYAEGVVPARNDAATMPPELGRLGDRVKERFDRLELTAALDEIWTAVRALNRFVEEQAPWKLAKDPERADELDATLFTLAEGLRTVSILLYPYIPKSAVTVLDAFGQAGHEQDLSDVDFGDHAGGADTQKIPPLFPKLDQDD